MHAPLDPIVLQTATPTSGPGPTGLVDYVPSLVRVGWFVGGTLVVVLLGWYVVEPAIASAVARRNRNNPTLQEAISRYMRLAVLVVAVFVGAGVAGYGRFLANSALVIAAGTLAVGVAGQAVIGSLISGLVLVADPEFNIGNYIEWADGEGTIQSITLRMTRVQTPDGELVTIPNTVLTEQAITRPYGRKRRRITGTLGLAYDDDVEAAVTHLESVTAELEGVVDDPEPFVYVDELGSDAVIVRVHFWVDNPSRRDLLRIKSEFTKEAKDRLEAAGITVSPASQRNLRGELEITGSSTAGR